MDDLFSGGNAPWLWMALGLVLATAELVVPGIYLLWLAIAALLTGMLALAVEPPLLLQVIHFVFLALIIVFSVRRWLEETPIGSSDPLMNNRVARLVGETGTLATPIEGGTGRVRHGDSEWQAQGPDLAAGTRVRITGARGTVLLVEPASAGDTKKAKAGGGSEPPASLEGPAAP